MDDSDIDQEVLELSRARDRRGAAGSALSDESVDEELDRDFDAALDDESDVEVTTRAVRGKAAAKAGAKAKGKVKAKAKPKAKGKAKRARMDFSDSDDDEEEEDEENDDDDQPGNRASDSMDDDDDEMDLEDGEDDDFNLCIDPNDAPAAKSKKRARAAAASSRGKGKAKDAKGTALASDEEPELEREMSPFRFEYDEEGYGDEQDRAQLAAKNMLERESILAERLTKRNEALDEYNMMKEQHQRRVNAALKGKGKGAAAHSNAEAAARKHKKAALDAMAASKGGGAKRGGVEELDEDEFDEEEDFADPKQQRRGQQQLQQQQRRASTGGSNRDARNTAVSLGPPLTYLDLVSVGGSKMEIKSHILLTRSKLEKLVQIPGFDRVATGGLVRILAHADVAGKKYYRLFRIKEVKHRGYSRRYKFGEGNAYADVRIFVEPERGASKSGYELTYVSGAPPLESEWEEFVRQLDEAKAMLPTKNDEEEVGQRVTRALGGSFKTTEQEQAEHRDRFEMLNPERLNLLQKKIEIEERLKAIAGVTGTAPGEAHEYADEIHRLKRMLEIIEEVNKRREKEPTGTTIHGGMLRELFRKNRQENLSKQSAPPGASGQGVFNPSKVAGSDAQRGRLPFVPLPPGTFPSVDVRPLNARRILDAAESGERAASALPGAFYGLDLSAVHALGAPRVRAAQLRSNRAYNEPEGPRDPQYIADALRDALKSGS
ncbi:Protein RTF1-like [Porphyridium purpureum]|uniref:Protein RTF1-like n=1 Tax=Porphyridium purpureum TaxID=35688 RepID=A0A5J4YTZ5_PORPP|nr:Protein RTF1-like [Porphyridium purpureum]|eukprot:POR3119..scf227_4